MIANQARILPAGGRIASMKTLLSELTTGERIQFLRKQKKIKQEVFAQMIGVNAIYVSQIENDHRRPGRPLMRLIAQTLETSIGFLECETDDPTPPQSKALEPTYFSAEADAAARLIDDAPPEERTRMLAVLRALASTAQAQEGTQESAQELTDVRRKKRVISPRESSARENIFAKRLINRDKVRQTQANERAGL